MDMGQVLVLELMSPEFYDSTQGILGGGGIYFNLTISDLKMHAAGKKKLRLRFLPQSKILKFLNVYNQMV